MLALLLFFFFPFFFLFFSFVVFILLFLLVADACRSEAFLGASLARDVATCLAHVECGVSVFLSSWCRCFRRRVRRVHVVALPSSSSLSLVVVGVSVAFPWRCGVVSRPLRRHSINELVRD